MDDDTPEKRSAPVALIISIITALTALAAIAVAFAAGLFRFGGSSDPQSDRTVDPSGDAGQPGAGETGDDPGAGTNGGGEPGKDDGGDAGQAGGDDGNDSGSGSADSCDADFGCGGGSSGGGSSDGGSSGGGSSCDTSSCETSSCDSDLGGCPSSGSLISIGVATMSVMPLVAVDRLAPQRDIRRRSTVTLPARCGLVAISGYRRWVSPRTRTRCRFIPSCSAYGRSTVSGYGLATGSRLALRRIRRCTRSVPMGTPDAPP